MLLLLILMWNNKNKYKMGNKGHYVPGGVPVQPGKWSLLYGRLCRNYQHMAQMRLQEKLALEKS